MDNNIKVINFGFIAAILSGLLGVGEGTTNDYLSRNNLKHTARVTSLAVSVY